MSEEIWRSIAGCEGFYEASNLGRVRSCSRFVLAGYGSTRFIRSRVLVPSTDKDGYLTVNVCGPTFKKKTMKVHCLVLRAFVGLPPEGLQSLHANGVPNDCRLENLSYGTGVGNWQDRRRHGRGTSGENNPNAKLTNQQVLELCKLDNKLSYRQRGQQFGISGEHASRLIKRNQNVSVN